MQDSLCPESDCIIVGYPSCVADLDPEFTESRYVLTKQPVPFSRFLGVLSLVDCCWIQRPKDSDLALMTDYTSDRDVMLHIAYRRYYWQKRNQNERDRVFWTRRQHIDYVTERLTDPSYVNNFITSFQTQRAASAKPAREGPTPNDRPLKPPVIEEDRRISEIRKQISERFKEGMKREVAGKPKASEKVPRRRARNKQKRPQTAIH